MAVKEWFRKLRPVQLYIVLALTIAYFVVAIIATYITHCLTLRMNAYHMVCNIVSLFGCIASIKYENDNENSCQGSMASLKASSNSLDVAESTNKAVVSVSEKSQDQSEKSNEKNGKGSTASIKSSSNSLDAKTTVNSKAVVAKKKAKQTRSEKRMKNTFGWARIDTVTMLVCCVLLASFCFSILVDSMSVLVHVIHKDAMHYPLTVMSIGAAGVLLNAICYFLIGGYTFNQGIFLHFTSDGNVILKRNLSKSNGTDVSMDSATRRSPLKQPMGQGWQEMCRDVLGCLLIIADAGLVHMYMYLEQSDLAAKIDPIFAIISSVLVMALSYKYMKESGMILLQTIPNHINIDLLQKELLAAFPDIVNVHDLHVWQLNGEKVVSTVHIIYADPSVCARITDQITSFFIEMGITHVTIQPEFSNMKPYLDPNTECLIRCQSKTCNNSTCCWATLDEDDHDHHHHHHHHHDHSKHEHVLNRKFSSKEILPADNVDLTKFKINIGEVNELTCSTPDIACTGSGEQQREPPVKESIKLRAISAIELSHDRALHQQLDVNVAVLNKPEDDASLASSSKETSIAAAEDSEEREKSSYSLDRGSQQNVAVQQQQQQQLAESNEQLAEPAKETPLAQS
ncbi:uncharacterized protein LOC106650385 isoform X2 [Trichogramma pretiosum]|uniref:uncharacterized protein LOC106650385 isoform X2 n=1 Tax=Trichogramma pretiosum TaxID=7493 RepID=UPI0006C9D4B8|nr:uncharacterized protein LOC106650385 isoform X2 [Trichogramma pretiosum]